MTKLELEEKDAIVMQVLTQLREHFDTVHIFATTDDGTEVYSLQRGSGNIYARIGQIDLWLQDAKKDGLGDEPDE